MEKIKGGIDGFRNGIIAGWVVPTACINVELDGRFVDTTIPNAPRPDVVAAGLTNDQNVGIAYRLDWEKIAEGDALNFSAKLGDKQISLPGAPIELEPIRHNAKQLRNLLALPPFDLDAPERSGDDLIFQGNLISYNRDGTLSLELRVNGKPFDKVEWCEPSQSIKQYFWFLPTGKSHFSATLRGTAISDTIKEFRVEPIYTRTGQPIGPYLSYDIPFGPLPTNLPDEKAQHRVMGWSNDFRFWMYGRSHMNAIVKLIARYRQVSDWSSVALLDWGCGCGRIARHFLESDVRPGRVVGVDIDPVSIAWCQKNLLGAEFHTTGLQPPLAFPNDSFDFIHGNSVFTHLDEANQDLWLAELGRLLKPKGIAVLTIHSKSALSYGSADSTFIADWTDKGIFFPGHNTTIDEVISDHTYYYNTFHTHQYVQSNWSIFLDILEIHEMVFGYQDVVILRKP